MSVTVRHWKTQVQLPFFSMHVHTPCYRTSLYLNLSALNAVQLLTSVFFPSFIKSCFCFIQESPLYCSAVFLLSLTNAVLFLCSGRVRTRRQSSGSAVGANATVTDSRGRSRAKVVSQSQRKCSHCAFSHLTHFTLLQELESLFYSPPCQMWPSSFSEKHTLSV